MVVLIFYNSRYEKIAVCELHSIYINVSLNKVLINIFEQDYNRVKRLTFTSNMNSSNGHFDVYEPLPSDTVQTDTTSTNTSKKVQYFIHFQSHLVVYFLMCIKIVGILWIESKNITSFKSRLLGLQ